jgi:hypothetical protein
MFANNAALTSMPNVLNLLRETCSCNKVLM